jgi:hypothetical protein
LFLLAVALLLPAQALADSVRLMNTLVLEYRGDNGNDIETDDDYGVGLNKLYLDGETGDTSLSLQVDAVYFSDRPDLLPGVGTQDSSYSNDARLERITLRHSLGDTNLLLGDTHMQLGRGIALSLRKVDELGLDQAVRGGSVGWEGELATARAFAGWTNIANLDGVTQKHLEDPNDLLLGASTIFHVGIADVSVHGLYLKPRIPTLEGHDQDQTVLGGGYVDLPLFSRLSLYAEGAIEQYRIATSEEIGSALYASADMDLELVSLLVEGVWLDKFQVAGSYDETLQRRNTYNQPPTLERFDQEVLDNQDVRGGRAKVSRSFLEGSLVLHVNGLYRQYGPDTAAVDAVHGYGGFEFTYGTSRWFASSGYREELQRGEVIKTMVHGESDWVQSLGAGHSFQLTVAHESRTFQARPYVRGTTLVGFDRSDLGALMLEVGYDTFNEKTQQLFFAGIAAWRSYDWLTMRAVLGSQRGGIKCIGGVCRDFPAFSGGRLEAVVHHDLL